MRAKSSKCAFDFRSITFAAGAPRNSARALLRRFPAAQNPSFFPDSHKQVRHAKLLPLSKHKETVHNLTCDPQVELLPAKILRKNHFAPTGKGIPISLRLIPFEPNLHRR